TAAQRSFAHDRRDQESQAPVESAAGAGLSRGAAAVQACAAHAHRRGHTQLERRWTRDRVDGARPCTHRRRPVHLSSEREGGGDRRRPDRLDALSQRRLSAGLGAHLGRIGSVRFCAHHSRSWRRRAARASGLLSRLLVRPRRGGEAGCCRGRRARGDEARAGRSPGPEVRASDVQVSDGAVPRAHRVEHRNDVSQAGWGRLMWPAAASSLNDRRTSMSNKMHLLSASSRKRGTGGVHAQVLPRLRVPAFARLMSIPARSFAPFLALVIAVGLCCVPARAAEALKFAFLGSLSGPFALQGEETLKSLQAAADVVNARGGVGGKKIEIVAFDNKGSPQESLIALKQAIDQDIRYIVSGVSNVAHALTDAIAKHNARSSDRPVLFLDYGALDPALTEAKCNFWHFRFEPHADTQLDVLTRFMAKQADVRKVYLINQDYAFGQAVSRSGKEMLAARRPDIQIVGDELIPFGKVKDFAPYVAKIRASGADSVLTGNWGNDLSLLIKAGNESNLNV